MSKTYDLEKILVFDNEIYYGPNNAVCSKTVLRVNMTNRKCFSLDIPDDPKMSAKDFANELKKFANLIEDEINRLENE